MLNGKNILFISSWSWEGSGEEAVIMEMLAGANNIVWISPFGSLNGNLLPDFKPVRTNLTIYRPGVNFLPLPAMRKFNDWRRLTQVIMYLLEKEFTPNLVWLGDPLDRRFAGHFQRKEVPVIYYGSPDGTKIPRGEEEALAEAVDMLILSDRSQYTRFADSGKTVLVEATDIFIENREPYKKGEPSKKGAGKEQKTTEVDAEREKKLEEMFMDDLQERLERICHLIEGILSQ
ncbi:MAG: hypothetical protein SVV67_03980 [Bacillota bacterium]|nr:hypothetical protein [Bacillota bacterium]